VTWVRGGIDDPSRPEKISINLPPGVRLENAPGGQEPSHSFWRRGEIDAFIAPRVPRLASGGNPNIGWLFPDPIAAGKDYYKRTGIFPDHARPPACAARWSSSTRGCRRAVLKAFEQAKAKCLEELEDTATSKCTLAVCRRAAQGRAAK